MSARKTAGGSVLPKGKQARPSKAESAYDLIRTRVIDGTYRPGTRLVLDQLARDLRMSTVPIREAIRRLEAEGYVTFRHNVGAEVASVDLRRYADTMGAVAIIEAAATGLSAEHLGADDIQRLRDINAALVESLESFDPMRFTHYNHEFHSVIFSKCPNTYLIALLEREWALLSSVRRSSFAFVPKRAREAAMEHAHLIELIENKASPEEIESYARSHRMATVDALLRQLTEEADRPL